MANPVYHQREGFAVVKVQFSDFGDDLPSGCTKLTLDEAGLIHSGDEADEKRVKETRLGLERVRLLRSFEREGAAYYELAHDHLAAEIASRIGQEEMQAKLARELLRREMDNWCQARLLIRPEVLALIHERRGDLKRLEADELNLLFRSALASGYKVEYWFQRARQGGVEADAIAQEGLRSDNFRTRAAAVATLGELGAQFSERLIPMLADDYPQVRAAAIRTLEQLRPEGTWRAHLQYECYVPAGESTMGDQDEAWTVSLDAYYIGKYPVTNADYKRYADATSLSFDIPENKTDHPVSNLSWHDAERYASWAGVRLLTEAEWEKAASWDEERTRKSRYPWGDNFNPRCCNTAESGLNGTTSVHEYSPQGDSFYGCADMSGNIWEWTKNEYPEPGDFLTYDLAAVRLFLRNAFTVEELRRFCQQRVFLRPLLARIGTTHSLNDMIDSLMVYCRENVLMGELIVQAAEYNPRQYQKHYTLLHGDWESTQGEQHQYERANEINLGKAPGQTVIKDFVNLEYDIAAIRQLLLHAFSPAELRRFCQDRPTFHPVLDEFGWQSGLAAMVDVLVWYCQSRVLFPELLAEVQKENPWQYDMYSTRLYVVSERLDGDVTGAAQDSMQPNMKAICNLVRDAFTLEELIHFCRDRSPLQSVLSHLGPADGLERAIEVLVSYSQDERLFPYLLSQIHEHNPRQFLRYTRHPTEGRDTPPVLQSEIVAIRNLMYEAFQTPHHLLRFCHDRPVFRPVVHLMGSNAGLGEIADVIIDYCSKRVLFYELLSDLQKTYPQEYERHFGQFYGSPSEKKKDTMADRQVLRGGSFQYTREYARPTYRLPTNPDIRLGFRGVRIGFSTSEPIHHHDPEPS